MKPSRTLALKREALRELTAAELDAVAGAGATDMSCLDAISACVPCLPTFQARCTE